MDQKAKKQNLMLGIFVLTIIGIVFVWFIYYRPTPVKVAEVVSEGSNIPLKAIKALEAAKIIDSIELDLSVFDLGGDNIISGYRDTSVSIELVDPKDRGRKNPFLPY